MGLLCRLTATLTAKSADDGCCWWVVRVVVLAAESVAQGIDGVPLESESDVGVAEEFLDYDEFDALFQEQGGGRVAEVVEADAANISLAEERGEGVGESSWVDWSALRGGEYVPAVLPRGAYGLTLALLLLVVTLQRLETAGGEGDAAFGGPGLGGQRGEPACAGALQGSADRGGARVEVEVFPAEAEEFALAESGVEGEFKQRVQPVFAGGREEQAGLGFVGGEGFKTSGPWGAGVDVAGDVA
ncbi:hypothetical protein GCM10010269_31900 [Streptomyces humidus]|uniref:Uncharacterized protein n=1 Tax=Streptomyces humidus TaxID=52259 RepID=A0A918FWK9_9ACTN|nr:hypothetical protein GCM10010269_31900 [Streptomyces humidus]